MSVRWVAACNKEEEEEEEEEGGCERGMGVGNNVTEV
jgi:hypothetical protein